MAHHTTNITQEIYREERIQEGSCLSWETASNLTRYSPYIGFLGVGGQWNFPGWLGNGGYLRADSGTSSGIMAFCAPGLVEF